MPLRSFFAAVCLSLGLASNAGAQPFPSKAVRIIVPWPPGGGIDILVRAIAAELSSQWKQSVNIENRAGAGSLIGTEAVAKSAPDGYTLLASVNQTFAANRYLYKSLPYDPEKSFIPMTLMVQSDHILLANPELPANDLRELVAHARKQAGKLNYGSFGSGSQPNLVYEMLKKNEGIDILHVPYKGIAPLLSAVTAGEVPLATGSAGVAGELLRSGRLKALAIAGQRRSLQFPAIATAAEQGYPYVLASIWYGLFAPAGTPPAIVEKIGADVRTILKTPSFAEKQATSKGLEVIASGSEELATVIRDESIAVGEMIRAAGVQPE